MSSNKGFCSFILDLTDERFDVWNGPMALLYAVKHKTLVYTIYVHVVRYYTTFVHL